MKIMVQMTIENDHKNTWIITVNWNREEDTRQCLQSFNNDDGILYNFLLVDNGSIDSSGDNLRREFPHVHIIRNEKNLGFAAGFNRGIEFALNHGADYLLLVNNDTEADPEMMKFLLSAISDDQNIGVLSPIIYYFNNKNKIWSQGGFINPILLEKFQHQLSIKIIEPSYRTFFTGCCLFLKKEVIEDVGLFDESFFLYYEDLDYSLRIMKKGIKMKVVPQAKIWHKVATSSGGSNSPQERYYMAKSSALYFKKHMNMWQTPLILLYRLGSAFLWTLKLLGSHQYRSCRFYWKGLFDGWFNNKIIHEKK